MAITMKTWNETAKAVFGVCPRCQRPWHEHGDVVLRCPR